MGLKAELASRWLNVHQRLQATGWSVAATSHAQKRLAVAVSGGGELDGEEAVCQITDAYDDGAALLVVKDPGPGALPALLEMLGLLEVRIPVFLEGKLDWPPVLLALTTWLFDRIIIHGTAPESPGRRLWPGMREAAFLARAGEEVTYMTHLPTPAEPWLRRLASWGSRLGITVEVTS